MTGLDFFTGMGLLRHAADIAGIESVGACEIDDSCRTIYEMRTGCPPLWRNILDIRPSFLPYADVWYGGFPCQDISHASGGRATYLEGDRSGFWFAWLDLIRAARPPFLVVENVAANLARWLPTLLGGLAACGYDAEWRVLSARAFGAPHLRKRLALIAHQGGLAADHAVPHAHQGGLADDAQPHCAPDPDVTPSRRGDAHRLVRWSPTPPAVRVADGPTRRLDRLRVAGCGNGVFVPQWVWVFRRLIAAFDPEVA